MTSLWYPYAQMKTQPENEEVVSAEGVYLTLKGGTQLIDATSSWWSVIHGYNHPKLNEAITSQVQKMSHVMLGGLSHEPAKKLAEKLVDITPEGLNHIFFSDSGSVACEVALKMAIQYYANQNQFNKKNFIALKKGYHGDTLGVMSVGTDDESMHAAFKHVLAEQHIVTPDDINELESLLKAEHKNIAGFIVEPLMQGAGGFILYSAKYLKEAKALCEKYDVLFICDEVATGFCRLGHLFGINEANISPDIMVLGKGLTAGYIGHAATCASSKVFNAFYSDDPNKAFMHGPTFMGNPLACAVALKSIELIEEENYLEKVSHIESKLNEYLKDFKSLPIIDIRIKGAMACIEVDETVDMGKVQAEAKKMGVWLRPFGRFIYTMPPYIVSDEELKRVVDAMKVSL
jgi:adenosylmethionine---8-amino-7-oxononanoate aminotransferase